jgi:hexosaminidase
VELRGIGEYFIERFAELTGKMLAVQSKSSMPHASRICLRLDPSMSDLEAEGYRLKIADKRIELTAPFPVGLFWGTQTLLQLILIVNQQGVCCEIPTGEIIDAPRFPYRGVMLDVARHFFPPPDIKHLIDLIALYKINHLHLHLTDDQGWRIEIKSWPNLTTIGGSTQVGGGQGGFYAQAEYAELVAYANSRYITIVPEIDLPGHTNAALASYPELNCDGIAPDLYTGMEVGFSSLCIDKLITYQFLGDVIAEVSAITPGQYFHIGGDEAKSTKQEDYQHLIAEVQKMVTGLGKRMVGWQEISHCDLTAGSIVQYWTDQSELGELSAGVKLLMSPARKAYLDMKYNPECELGLEWAGHVNLEDAYSWDPAGYLEGMSEDRIIGLEAPLWSETLESIADIEYMMFPRLLGYSEIGWSQSAGRNFEEYRQRLAVHAGYLKALGINFYRSELDDWA